FSDVIVHFALAPEFHEATKYVRYLVLGLTLQALFLPSSDFLLFFKKNRNLNFVTISGVILQYLILAIFYLYGGLTVMKIIYSILISATYVLLTSWYMITLVDSLPWLYFSKIKNYRK